MDCTALELDAVKFAKSAVSFDQKGKYNEAAFYYKVTCSLQYYSQRLLLSNVINMAKTATE